MHRPTDYMTYTEDLICLKCVRPSSWATIYAIIKRMQSVTQVRYSLHGYCLLHTENTNMQNKNRNTNHGKKIDRHITQGEFNLTNTICMI